MSKVFNTEFEISLRISLLLLESDSPLDIDEVAASDFVATYAGAFCDGRRSINGDNRFMYNEYAVRRELAGTAIRRMVLEGTVSPELSGEGFSYTLTEMGRGFADSLSSPYAFEYRDAAVFALAYVKEAGASRVLREINCKKS